MRLNRVETVLMNNPVRSYVQWHSEASLLERLGGTTVDQSIIEIECGRGVGTEIVLERFRARRVLAFDFDPRMAAAPDSGSGVFRRLAFRSRSLTPPHSLQPDASFDAAFDFLVPFIMFPIGTAVSEVRRVLKPGGRFSSRK